jgi:hypothetical protein
MFYLDYIKGFLSWHYFVDQGEKYQSAVAAQVDNLVAAAKQAVVQRFWSYALDDALPYLLQNYNLDLVEAFTPAQTRKQIGDAWDTWDKAGSEEGIIHEVERLGYPLVTMIPVWQMQQVNDGITDTIKIQPTLKPDPDVLFWPKGAPPFPTTSSRDIATQGEWGSFDWWIDLNFHFSSFFVVIHDPPFAFRRWGDPGVWGNSLRWDALVTGDRVALKRLYLTIKKFNAAEWSCRGVVFSYSGNFNLGNVVPLSVSVRSTFDVWVCGNGGYIAHFDGVKWTQVPSGVTVDLFSINITPNGGVVAIGDNGTIIRWDGTKWNQEVSGTSVRLFGYAYTHQIEWICGENGTLLLNGGFGWFTSSSPVGTDLGKMWAFSSTDIWAVGRNGVAIHFDGSTWTSTSTGIINDLSGIWGSASNNVWAVGAAGAIINWNGTSWSIYPRVTTQPLFSIYGDQATGKAVAVGGEVIVFDGAFWKLAPADLPGQTAFSISGTIYDNYWTVTAQGNVYNLNLDGFIYVSKPWDNFNWDDGTRFNLKYVIKWMKEIWET